MSIKLTDILQFDELKKYKVHLANWNGQNHHLDVFVRNKDEWKEWKEWNSWRSERDDFNREYIFSLMEFYPESNVWLFGGVYRVVKRLNNPHSHSYVVELTDQFKPLR